MRCDSIINEKGWLPVKTRQSKKLKLAGILVLLLALLVSVGLNVYHIFWGYDSYLQSTDQIYVMEAGILRNNIRFRDGEAYEISYDFDNEEYTALRETYGIEQIAGEGTELERALRLMDEFAPRLHHKSDYDNHVDMNALSLLAYSLDNKSQGVNCRSKAQILNEMCLALEIYARKVWLMPSSMYDNDCHVVNEIWDSGLGKWVMLDITNNEYWVDETGTPLSILEIREKGAMGKFCTPVHPGDSLESLGRLKEKYLGDFLYIMKNMVYLEYCGAYTTGDGGTHYLLFPENLDTDYEYLISREACTKSPVPK